MIFRSRPELTAWARGSASLWLFLDYDGTLADFAPTPDHIEPSPRIARLLEELTRLPGMRLTILSGRRLEHVRALVPVPGLFLAGTYGIEILTPEGELTHRVDYASIRAVLDEVKPRWEESLRGQEGFFLEDKGWALALHARFAEDSTAQQVIRRARRAASSRVLAGKMRLLGGHRFLEIAPAQASKGDTVSYLLGQYPLPEARLLCIGDDDKDEEAFYVIHARGGAAVKVVQPTQASRPTEADFFFESPGETLDWLAELAQREQPDAAP